MRTDCLSLFPGFFLHLLHDEKQCKQFTEPFFNDLSLPLVLFVRRWSLGHTTSGKLPSPPGSEEVLLLPSISNKLLLKTLFRLPYCSSPCKLSHQGLCFPSWTWLVLVEKCLLTLLLCCVSPQTFFPFNSGWFGSVWLFQACNIEFKTSHFTLLTAHFLFFLSSF